MNQPHIVIIDDDDDIRLNLEATLGGAGYRTTSAASGQQALEILRAMGADLVLLDIMMPDMDGHEVLRHIRSDEKLARTAVVFASALRKTSDKVEGLDLGADDYITKPYNIDELLAKLRAVFRVREYQRRLERLVTFARAMNTLDDTELKQAIERFLPVVVPLSLFSIFVTSPDHTGFKLFAHNHMEAIGDELNLTAEDSPLMRQALDTGERVIVENFPASPYAHGDDRAGKYTDPFALCQPMKVGGNVVGTLNLACVGKGGVSSSDLDIVALVGEMIGASLANLASHTEQKRLATTDGLTRVTNHRSFQERLLAELERTMRSGRPLTLVLIDIDFFKKINDTHGHLAGDAALVGLAAALKGEIRIVDTVARYGGEEFALLLPETPLDEAIRVCERIRERASSLTFDGPDGPFSFTISLGVTDTTCGEIKKPTDLIGLADEALYAAKEGGRDKTVRADGKPV